MLFVVKGSWAAGKRVIQSIGLRSTQDGSRNSQEEMRRFQGRFDVPICSIIRKNVQQGIRRCDFLSPGSLLRLTRTCAHRLLSSPASTTAPLLTCIWRVWRHHVSTDTAGTDAHDTVSVVSPPPRLWSGDGDRAPSPRAGRH